ncbi:MAG TPA: PKD domain-containing protein [Flavobacteriales bacterium]|nr:PKD domain-containing protein [Flavobacteriales bacterium]
MSYRRVGTNVVFRALLKRAEGAIHPLRNSARPVLGLLFAALITTAGSAQCLTTISAYPYTEGFETAAAWTSGGTNSDWAWGIPAHPTINSAEEGINAWCVGTLTGSAYADGEQSWLETPCFDLSSLNYPWISFWLFWETEPGYDGLGLQYSVDAGASWTNLGNVNDDDCLTTNWFNTTSITALNLASPRQGWSGTSTTGGCASGQGSGGWVKASHCLDDIPTGAPVKFRFIFGAGTICNTFDGIGLDDVYIGEAPELEPEINYSCAGNTIQFYNGATLCDENSTWNFGDPGSGANNTANTTDASHTFPGPDTYTVSLTMTGPCTAPVTVTVDVTIAELGITTTPVGCQGNSGTATAEVTGSAGPFTYDWTPGNENTQTITGLGPGTYTVLVQAPDMCAVQGTVDLEAGGESVTGEVEHTDVTCAGLSDGTATATASGGAGGYTYAWAPSGGTDAQATGLAAGDYTVTVTDADDCFTEVDVTINEPDPVVVTPSDDVTICAGGTTTLDATAEGGVGGFTFAWSPAGPEVSPPATADHTVIATDANGCSSEPGVVTVTVTEALEPSFTVDVDQGCAPLCVTFTDDTGIAGVRAWDFGDGGTAGDGIAPAHCYLDPGVFDVTLSVTDAAGCNGTFTLPEAVEVLATPVASIGSTPTVALIDAPTFQFTDRSVGSTLWAWSFGDPLQSTASERSPSFTYPAVGCYTVELEASNDAGCSTTATTEVCVEDAFALYAPNTFSPNNDGINDFFGVSTTVEFPVFFELMIHDRWGQVQYSTNAPFEPWDGEGTPIGVYIWQARVRDTEGKLQERQGHVTLVR